MWIRSLNYKEQLGNIFFKAVFILIPIFAIGGTFFVDYSFEETPDVKSVSTPLIEEAAALLYNTQPDVNVVRVFNKLDASIINGTAPRFGETINIAMLGLGTMLGIGSNIVSTSWAALAYVFVYNIIGGIAMIWAVWHLNPILDQAYYYYATGVSGTLRKHEYNMATSNFVSENPYHNLEIPKMEEYARKCPTLPEGQFFCSEQVNLPAYLMFALFLLCTMVYAIFMTNWLNSGMFETDFHNVLEYVVMIDNQIFTGTEIWQQLGAILALVFQIMYVLSIVLLGEFTVTKLTWLFGLESKPEPLFLFSDAALFSYTSRSNLVFEHSDPWGEATPKIQ